VHAIAVEGAGAETGDVDVPDLVGALLDRQPHHLAAGLGRIEEAELDGGGVLAEEGEVHALAVGGSAERIRGAGA